MASSKDDNEKDVYQCVTQDRKVSAEEREPRAHRTPASQHRGNRGAKWLSPLTARNILLIYCLIWCLYVIIMLTLPRLEEAGQFGDAFGAFNALVSGVAMLGVVVAIFLQREQIHMQAEDLDMQRKELKMTREEIRLQTKVFSEQRNLARNSTLHKIMADILYEYRSIEMYIAVRSLWEFYRDHQDDLTKAYEIQRLDDAERIKSLPPSDQLEAERATLHFKRRLVSQFYHYLAGLNSYGILPSDIICAYWNVMDLRIIPDVLLPIEEALGKSLSCPREEHFPLIDRLRKLYEDTLLVRSRESARQPSA